jgi:uncharacterized protein YcbX
VTTATLGPVAVLTRYPVKSMLGEELGRADLTSSGFDGDRALALIDRDTGRVASAKQPRLWRALLQLGAAMERDAVRITLPGGAIVHAGQSGIDDTLSRAVGRQVFLSDVRAAGAAVARPAPEDVIAHGQEADVPFEMLVIGQGTPGATFVDYAPVHLVTTATLSHVGVEAVRYRPNLVIGTPSGVPFAENDWVGREIVIGDVTLRGMLPTPRCAVPTLEHGRLPRSTGAVRTLLEQNRIDVPGFGVLPCLGLYAEVVHGGTIGLGDEAVLR